MLCSTLTSNNHEHACQTLNYALDDISNSTMIILEDGIHPLDAAVNTTGLNTSTGWLGRIKIAGLNVSSATIKCIGYSYLGAGLVFSFIQDLHIANVTFTQCGSLLSSTVRDANVSDNDTVLRFRSAVYVENCTNVVVESCTFANNNGIGLVLYDTNGFVFITDSTFFGNMVPKDERAVYPGGGGIYIEHTYCTPGRLNYCDFENNPFSNRSMYTIQGCLFHKNHATTLPNMVSTVVRPTRSTSARLGKGGAIGITLKGRSAYNNFTVSNSDFTGNSAAFGGGLDIQFQDYVKYNSFTITNCHFVDNIAKNGAGGTRIGLLWYVRYPSVTNDELHYQNTNFIRNSAKWGGGTDFFSSRLSSEYQNTNTMKFTNCSWIENSAETGAAVNLSPDAWGSLGDGELPTLLFENCKFRGNDFIHSQLNLFLTSGILYITAFTVNFTSSVTFSKNNGTSVYANAAGINILDNTEVTFSENRAIQGGALTLVRSSIQMFPSSILTFINNTASDIGGAMYIPSSIEADFVFSRSCFIPYFDSTFYPNEWNASFYFEGNEAGRYGHSIYAASLLPCARSARPNGIRKENVQNVFRWYPFHYSHPERDFNIASDPAKIQINSAQSLRFSPGQIYNIQPHAWDDLNQSLNYVYKASLSHIKSDSKVELDSVFEYVSDGNIKIKGSIDSTFQLNLQTIGTRKTATSINVTLINCPPGFIIPSNSSTPEECICSANTDNHQYDGITRCDVTKFKALLDKGFWMGCINDSNHTVITSECPPGYCHNTGGTNSFLVLPQTCEELDNFLCGPRNRTGRLCGECQEGMSVYYHSQRYLCGNCSSHNGRLGWLFYCLSELVPLTILFTIIMVYNIRLTSGLANSFVFFMQLIDFFEVNSLGAFTLPTGVSALTSVYRFIFGIFNMDFLRFDRFSFCLWEGATVLDMLAFKYVTTACALILLLLVIFSARYWPFFRRNLQHCSVIHGIAAFIIISYAQCAKVSFQILTRVDVRSEGLVAKESVVFLSGNVAFLGHHHQAYAIPAILTLLTLCTIPPVVLILYPAANSLFNSCQNSREQLRKCVKADRNNCMCKCCDLNRLKPLLDSFQGCYKDRFRFFAGLYFIYRLAISAAFAFATSTIEVFTCLEIIVISILTIHAITQPYQRRYYNIVDALTFADLAVINGLSLYNYYWSQHASTHPRNLTIAASFQVLLIYIPMLYMAVIISLKFACKWKRIRHKLLKLNQYIPLFEAHEDYIEFENGVDGSNDASQPFGPDHFPARLFN